MEKQEENGKLEAALLTGFNSNWNGYEVGGAGRGDVIHYKNYNLKYKEHAFLVS